MIERDVVHYLFASQFSISPREVDLLEADTIENMIYLHSLVKEKEEKAMEAARHG